MFTGLIETTGTVLAVEQREGSRRIAIAAPWSIALRTGDSIAVSGVCLTAVDIEPDASRLAFMRIWLRKRWRALPSPCLRRARR